MLTYTDRTFIHSQYLFDLGMHFSLILQGYGRIKPTLRNTTIGDF